METSPVYFAWVDPEETELLPEHYRWDEQILEATVECEEGDIPKLTVLMANPGPTGLLDPSRKRHAWFAYRVDEVTVEPIFFGRIDAIPGSINDELITIVFVAMPEDFDKQKRMIASDLRRGVGYDPVFYDLTKRDSADAALEGYSKMWHLDRITGEVTISDIIEAEDGVEVFQKYEVPFDSVNVEPGESPKTTVVIDATVEWDQRASGTVAIPPMGLSSYGGDGSLSDQPKVGTSIGGGWSVIDSVAIDKNNTASAITGSYSYSWQNKAKRHHNGDTMSINISRTATSDGSRGYILTYKSQTGLLDPFAVDDEGNPAPINIPASYSETSLYVLLWSVSSAMSLRYDANRKRSERILIKMQSDIQATTLENADNETVEVLEIPGSDVGVPILELTDWMAIRETVVAVGTVIFPEYPQFPGVKIAQICTVGGLTGSEEPEFDPIEGGPTIDNAVTWVSLGETRPDETPEDWTKDTEVPAGDVICPVSEGITPTYQDLVRSGAMAQPQSETEVTEGQIVRALNGSYQQCIDSGRLALRGAPFGWNLPNDVAGAPFINLRVFVTEPLFSTTWGVETQDGTARWVSLGTFQPTGTAFFLATQGGTTGEYRPPFNNTIGSVTVDNDIEWTCIGIGEIPIGGAPGNTPAPSYFVLPRGKRSIEYLLCVGRAYLLNKARCVSVSFQIPFLRALTLSCRKSAYLEHVKIPGGEATGKITKYSIVMKEGDFHGMVTMMCAIGRGATVSEVVGEPIYVTADYIGNTWQHFTGSGILLPDLEDITYSPPTPGVVDDGLVFPLTLDQVLIENSVTGTLAEQRSSIGSAVASAARAAQLGEIQPQSVQHSISLQRQIASLNENSVDKAIKDSSIERIIRLKPVTGGPYDGVYSLETSSLMVPKNIDFGEV